MADTIFALSSGRGVAGVAVIRLSGPAAGMALERLAKRPPPPARRASVRRLYDGATGALLDEAMILWFPAPASFTGEDCAEIHAHGGTAVVAGLLDALAALPGLRVAEPGEFTRRAFDHGRLDLTQTEALADLLAAQTAGQRAQALAQMGGSLVRLYEGWRGRLLAALAHVEAELDFADGEDAIADDLLVNARGNVDALAVEIGRHLDDAGRGERVRNGLAIAVVGPPNSGKSSFVNAMAKRDVSIVSTIAGTTRDLIEVHLNLGGSAAMLIDTAGLRESSDPIEQEGVLRARQRAASADLALLLVEDPADLAPQRGLLDPSVPLWTIQSKIDLAQSQPLDLECAFDFRISTHSGAGVADLVGALNRWAGGHLPRGDVPLLTRPRHRHHLEACRTALTGARAESDTVLFAEQLRLAARSLGALTGRIEVDEVLGAIFADFCIGK